MSSPRTITLTEAETRRIVSALARDEEGGYANILLARKLQREASAKKS